MISPFKPFHDFYTHFSCDTVKGAAFYGLIEEYMNEMATENPKVLEDLLRNADKCAKYLE